MNTTKVDEKKVLNSTTVNEGKVLNKITLYNEDVLSTAVVDEEKALNKTVVDTEQGLNSTTVDERKVLNISKLYEEKVLNIRKVGMEMVPIISTLDEKNILTHRKQQIEIDEFGFTKIKYKKNKQEKMAREFVVKTSNKFDPLLIKSGEELDGELNNGNNKVINIF